MSTEIILLACSKCRQDKPTSNFRKNNRTSRGYAYWCNQCHSARQKELGRPHETKYRRQQSTVNREQYLAYFKANHDTNKEARLLKARQWKQQNRQRNLTIVGSRRKRHKNAQPPWANTTLIQDVYAAANTKTRETGVPYVVDHYYPLKGKTVCGLHVAENLHIIPKQENLAKGNKHPDEFYESGLDAKPTSFTS